MEQNKNRRKEILKLLEVEISADTNKLAKMFNVSAMTIRRDFEYMSKKGLITTIHGGAMINTLPTLSNATQNQSEGTLDKRKIAKAAAAMIKPGDTLLLDAGTTVKELALELLGKEGITVLTNSILVMNVLAQADSKIRLIMLPGQFRKSSMAFFGAITNDFLNTLHVDYAFIGVMGVESKKGATVLDAEEGHTKSKFIEIADKSIILADHTKIGKSTLYTIDTNKSVTMLITGTNVDSNEIECLQKKGIEVYLV